MHCFQVRHLLQLYIDGRLSLGRLHALEQHVATCPSCRSDLYFLESLDRSFHDVQAVPEPADLTMNIMHRVALAPRYQHDAAFSPLRPSLTELAIAAVLATITMLGIFWSQPSLHAVLPFTNGHSILSLFVLDIAHAVVTMNTNTLMLGFWVVGTILGVWITLALAGSEMQRMEWFKSVKDRLPVW